MKNQIKTSAQPYELDPWLMFDIEAIDTVSELKLTDEERTNFITLFNQVSVKGTSSLEEHEAKIEEAWKERNISIDSSKASLICIYLHAPEDETRFVGHTGVLAETKDGLLFFEKYSNMAPFQASYFKNTDDLKKYLLSRSDLYGDKSELAPIITEGGKVL